MIVLSHDLSNQIKDKFNWYDPDGEEYAYPVVGHPPIYRRTFTLDYLLGKLPEIRLEKWRDDHIVVKYYTANGVASKLERLGKVVKIESDTPTEAVAKLILALPEEVFEGADYVRGTSD